MKTITKTLALCLGLALTVGCASAPKEEPKKEAEKKLEKIELTAAKTEVDVDEEVEITVNATPKNFTIQTESFAAMNGANITMKDKKYVFKATKAGDYAVQAKQDAIDSNVLKIKVVEEEQPEKEDQSAKQPETETVSDEKTAESAVGYNGYPHNNPNWNADEEQVVVGGDGTPHNGPASVAWIIANADSYMTPSQQVWVRGSLPQSKLPAEKTPTGMALFDTDGDTDQYLVLEGFDTGLQGDPVTLENGTTVAGSEITLTGTLSMKDGRYVLTAN